MNNLKALLVGGALGILSTLVGLKAAHACPLIDNYEEAVQDADEGAARGMHCEIIELRDGTYKAQCDEIDHEALAETCTNVSLDLGLTSQADIDSVYEACMVIGLQTGAVK